jgi:methanogenic corrinoid protein MtbC1
VEELADASRRRILSCLLDGPKSVSEIVQMTGLKQPNVSNHLGRLRERHIVNATKVGRVVSYSLAGFTVQEIVQQAVMPLQIVRGEADWNTAIVEFAESAIRGNRARCSELLQSVFTDDVSLEKLYIEFLTPVMYRIGEWYQAGRIGVSEEHLASEIMMRTLARSALMRAPVKHLGRTAVLGCSPDNYHVIGLRMVADCLRVRGWETMMLGQNVPVSAFDAAVQAHLPDLVLVSCAGTNLEGAFDLLRHLKKMQLGLPRMQIVAGGQHVEEHPDRFDKLGVDFLAKDLSTFLHEIAQQIESGSPATA